MTREFWINSIYDLKYRQDPNRLSSPIGGNRGIDQLQMTSQVSNLTRKTLVDMFPISNKKVQKQKLKNIKLHIFYCKIST